MKNFYFQLKKVSIDLFALRTNIFFLLAVLSAYSILLLAYRIYYTSTLGYLFLIWNLFLAWIPYLLSLIIRNYGLKMKNIWAVWGIIFAWLLFFPNAPYIVTDLFHLRLIDNMELWYDLILVVSFAVTGLFLGFISLIYIQDFLQKKYSEKIGWPLTLLALLLASFGIYLGRFLRWNSWDVISQPLGLFSDILSRIFFPWDHPRTYGMTLLFFVLLTFFYLILKAAREKDNF